jgi:hypothetical protein
VHRSKLLKTENVSTETFGMELYKLKTKWKERMAVFWVAVPCSLVEVYQRFRGLCCLHHQGMIALKMEAARSSETLVNFY